MRLNRNGSNFYGDKVFEEKSISFLKNKTKILDDMQTEEIIKDRDRQLQGADILCHLPKQYTDGKQKGDDVYIDVKSIASYLPTFCFELQGNKKSKNKGWLLEENLTDYYLVVYHDIENGKNYTYNKNCMTEDNVIWTQALLIKKERLINEVVKTLELESKMDLEKILNDILELSEENKKSREYFVYTKEKKITTVNSKEKKGDMWFVRSRNLDERPVNIIIRKNILETLATAIWTWEEGSEECITKTPSHVH